MSSEVMNKCVEQVIAEAREPAIWSYVFQPILAIQRATSFQLHKALILQRHSKKRKRGGSRQRETGEQEKASTDGIRERIDHVFRGSQRGIWRYGNTTENERMENWTIKRTHKQKADNFRGLYRRLIDLISLIFS